MYFRALSSSRRSVVAAVPAVLCLAIIVALAPAAVAAPVPGGTATAQNTIFSMSIGGVGVQIGVDTVNANWATTRTASAEMLLGQAGDLTVQGAKKVSTSKADGGTTVIAKRTVDLGGLGGLSVASGSVAAFVQPEHVASSVDLSAGSLDLFSGFAALESAGVHTITRVETTKATVTRTVSLGQAEMLAIGDLLAELGVDPLALACSSVEAAGTNLGVDTADACEQLTDVDGAITAARAELDAQKAALETAVSGFTLAQVLADQATVSGLSCAPGDVVCETLALAQILAINTANGYGAVLDGLSFNDAKDAMLARLAELEEAFAELDVLTGAVADAASGTCADVSGAIDGVVADVPDLDPVLTPLQDAVDETCAALADTVGSLLDTPLLSLDTISVSLTTTATVGAPQASVGGTLAALKVGNLMPVGTTLSLTQTDLNDKVEAVRDQVGDVLESLGVGLPVPELELMKTATSKGKRSDGTWYASASLTSLHFRLPSAVVDVPTSNPLGVLDGAEGFAPAKPAKAAAPGAPRAPVTTPEIALDAAKFTGAATFLPGVDGKTLPVTGIADGPGAVVLAMLFLAGAGVLRRFLLAAR